MHMPAIPDRDRLTATESRKVAAIGTWRGQIPQVRVAEMQAAADVPARTADSDYIALMRLPFSLFRGLANAGNDSNCLLLWRVRSLRS